MGSPCTSCASMIAPASGARARAPVCVDVPVRSGSCTPALLGCVSGPPSAEKRDGDEGDGEGGRVERSPSESVVVVVVPVKDVSVVPTLPGVPGVLGVCECECACEVLECVRLCRWVRLL